MPERVQPDREAESGRRWTIRVCPKGDERFPDSLVKCWFHDDSPERNGLEPIEVEVVPLSSLTAVEERAREAEEQLEVKRQLDAAISEQDADEAVEWFERAERYKAALEELARWGAEREQHSGASDLNRDEERGWNLALSGLEHRARAALQSGAESEASSTAPLDTSGPGER